MEKVRNRWPRTASILVASHLLTAVIEVNDVDVIDGYFTVELDFGSVVFDGEARWLEIDVRTGSSKDPNVYSTLIPRPKKCLSYYNFLLDFFTEGQ